MTTPPEEARPWIDTAARLIVVLVLVAAGLRVLWQGWNPVGEARVHAASAASGRSMRDILIVRPGMETDLPVGWEAVLRALHRSFGLDSGGLTAVSVLVLFGAACVAPLFLMRRPEAWPIGVLAVAATDPVGLARLLSGDPRVLTAAAVVGLALLSRTHRDASPRAVIGGVAVVSALACWMSGTWLAWCVLPAGCLLVGRARLAGQLGLGIGIGVLLAGLSSWHLPTLILRDLARARLVLSGVPSEDLLVLRFDMAMGVLHLVFVVFAAMIWRAVRGDPTRTVLSDPLLGVAAVAWVLGLATPGPWFMCGLPAVLAWLSLEVEEFILKTQPARSPKRLLVAVAAVSAAFLVVSENVRDRWGPPRSHVALLVQPPLRWALPDPGGVLYTDTQEVFFDLYPKWPQAPFRYVLGAELERMPSEDLSVYVRARRLRTADVLDPWIRRMGPADRVVVEHSMGGLPPPFGRLQWARVSGDFWSGRRLSP